MFSKLTKYLLQTFLFLLPIQTVYIVQDNFLNGEKWQYGTLIFYLTEMILWLVVVCFIVYFFILLKQNKIQAKRCWDKEKIFSVALLLFLLYLLFNTFFVAQNFEIAYQMTHWWMLSFLLFIILFSGFLKLKNILWSVVLGSIIPSILGVWQFLTQSSFANKFLGLAMHSPDVSGVSVVASDSIGRWLRSYGTFSNPNIFGGYLVLTIIFTFLLMKRVEVKKQKVFLMVFLLIETMALFFTFSRTAWIAWFLFIIFISVYCLVVNKKVAWPMIFSLVFFGILFSTFFSLVQNRVEVQSTYETKSISERVTGYMEALEIWDSHKYLGVGAGNYTLASFELDRSKVGSSYQPVHNIFLLFIVENGIVGFGFFCFILATFIIYFVSIVKRKQLFFSLILVFIFLILGVFDHYLLSSYVGFMIFSLYLAVIGRLSTE
ncbi:MAG: hypothetical protein A2493_01210 [Candidatus Magasanikbacteria bacterium RIFOXYC12_FULL_33_11]|uniref:O-antigen ligase-related domain-containing protein n=1 Tax=Candidatus Magasanikbacteria bacterium RIFOXYC12_FULL_33_11 TaxID=1798701 RepID=A0A1F6NNN7_9BACT|nr:MAG: hypothetical protein A2493_01210 [Candidatus Magasanikbacteria bacterium RIFOXYC12_FULL_33_11]